MWLDRKGMHKTFPLPISVVHCLLRSVFIIKEIQMKILLSQTLCIEKPHF